MPGKQTQYRCSFCGKGQQQVRRLIAGPGNIYICDECVALCRQIIEEDAAPQARAQPPPRSHPGLGEHVRELPVAQALMGNGTELSLLSLQIYANGFILHTRLLVAEPIRWPNLKSLVATDDCGGSYFGGLCECGGKDREWQLAFRFSPALNPAARELKLEVEEMRWERIVEEVCPGPWEFKLSL
jgi:hypothetical protein